MREEGVKFGVLASWGRLGRVRQAQDQLSASDLSVASRHVTSRHGASRCAARTDTMRFPGP